jgi:hypothetical protein
MKLKSICFLEPEAVHVKELELLDLKDNNGVSNTQVTQNSNTINEEKINENKNKAEIFNSKYV